MIEQAMGQDISSNVTQDSWSAEIDHVCLPPLCRKPNADRESSAARIMGNQ